MNKNTLVQLIIVVGLFFTLLSCGASRSSVGGELTGVRLASWNEPAPYGMVKIPEGHILLGERASDSLWGIKPYVRPVSIGAFWMDKHEVTNAQYRQFVHYVRDSIIRERLADPAYGGDDSYRITEDQYGEPIKPYLDWTKPIPTKKQANDDELRAINSLYYTNPVTGVRMLDPKQMLYKYERYDYRMASLYRNQLHQPEGNEKWEEKFDKPIMISKDTAWIDQSGLVHRETLTRELKSEYDFLNTYIVPIYPNEICWVNDFPNSTNSSYTKLYFNHPGYDDYPVVGVSWEQANAFCAWRTEFYLRGVKIPKGQVVEEFRLPTEAEWEYAARAGNSNNVYPWNSEDLESDNACYLGNFKPKEGDYTADKHLITAQVCSFSPNDFGLYDMAGNVAEWTSSAWSYSGQKLTDDINPEYRYWASFLDPYQKTLKVVKGGSWKDVARYIRSTSRSKDYQNKAHSYLGFRCVRTAISFQK